MKKSQTDTEFKLYVLASCIKINFKLQVTDFLIVAVGTQENITTTNTKMEEEERKICWVLLATVANQRQNSVSHLVGSLEGSSLSAMHQ